MEINDVYDKDRRPTGRIHKRGSAWKEGEYGMVVCVWVYDGQGKLLLTKRAPGKTAAGTWENSGGAVKSGENSRAAISRELFEETGIRAGEGEFELLAQCTDGKIHYDHYCLKRAVPLGEIHLQPGETVDVCWANFDQIHELIRQKKMCYIIGKQFCKLEQELRKRQDA